ncbi:MAG: CBS domain-containing protein [Anaerolineales bacterium]|nr:CBS domain-containing protein [Anaerolineales bacterium]
MDTKLTLLVVILHNLDLLQELLDAWAKVGIPGTTLLPSIGGYQAVNQLQRGGLASLLSIMEQASPSQRLILSLIDNPNTLATAISEAERVVGGFDRPHSGILFTLDVTDALGLRKWGDTRKLENNALSQAEEKKLKDRGAENLLSWFEEEVRDLHGEKTLTGWRRQRKQLVSVVFKTHLNDPAIVTVDDDLKAVTQAFINHPHVSMVCVENRAGRLVGIIRQTTFAEMMLVPAMPEQYIQKPDLYEKAIAYVRMDPEQRAFDIMEEPVFVLNEANLEQAFLCFQQYGLTGLPIVNKHYRVTGYLTLTELLDVYFRR